MIPNMGFKLGFGVPAPWGFGEPSGLQGQGTTGPWTFRGSRDFRGSQFNLGIPGLQGILRFDGTLWSEERLILFLVIEFWNK